MAEVTGLEGYDELIMALKGAENVAAHPEIKAAYLDEATDLKGEVERRAPGRLKEVVVGKLFKRTYRDLISFVAFDRHKRVGGDTIGRVAHLVEYGHGGPKPAPPHPFFRPAVRAYAIGRHVQVGISKALEAVWTSGKPSIKS